MISDLNSTNASTAPANGHDSAPAVNAIEVDHIVKKYGDFTAVDDVNFTVQEGEIFGLLGPNGAGKSTLIRMMTTLIPITAGHARILGHDVQKEPDAARRLMGVIPQALTSDLDLTIEENLNIYAKLYDVPAKKRKEAIGELLQLVDLTKWRSAQTKTLSGGMRRRLEIARGLVHSPRIFFLDEPTTGLDPVSRVAVWEMLEKLKRERDLTILVTTHYMDEADKLCDRIAIIDHGKMMALDSPLKLKASIPGKNILEAGFSTVPPGWEDTLRKLPDVADVKAVDSVFRISSNNGPRTTTALLEAVRAAGISLTSLSVQSTTLDDVFAHYTGRQLRDTLSDAVKYSSAFMYESKNG
jgi:ABC-2 type transport system ATP-binding protein